VAKTYGEIYLDLKARLRSLGVTTPELDAREMVSAAAEKTKEEFLRDRALYAGDGVEERIEWMLHRRSRGEPLPYILGEWEFFGLPMTLNNQVLIPRADTEVLARKAIDLALLAGEKARVLDLCTGSGCVGVAVAKYAENCRVVLADISNEALHVARLNAIRNGVVARTNCVRVDARQHPPEMLGQFDVICSNPPYVRSGDMEGLDDSVKNYEPHLALDGGEDGLDFYRAIAGGFKHRLKTGGHLLFEVGYDQAADVRKILAFEGFVDICCVQDTQGIDRVVIGTFIGQ